jgi:hypothetical protein
MFSAKLLPVFISVAAAQSTILALSNAWHFTHFDDPTYTQQASNPTATTYVYSCTTTQVPSGMRAIVSYEVLN